jgi:hypothetical protein
MLDEEISEPLLISDREELSTALRLLNHRSAPDRERYIRAIGENSLATAVKLNDLTHNMDLSRISNPSEKDLVRVERYKRECYYLMKQQNQE